MSFIAGDIESRYHIPLCQATHAHQERFGNKREVRSELFLQLQALHFRVGWSTTSQTRSSH